MQGFQMSKQSPRKRSLSYADIPGGLPIFNPAGAGLRDSQSSNLRSAMNYKLIHLIPIVVILCFFILWCFSSPVEIEIKDGRTILVPITKKPPKDSEATDVDLTVLALESSPDGFLSLSDSPYASIAFHNQSNVSFLNSHGHNASLTDSHELKASFSDSNEPNKLFTDSHVPNTSISVSNDSKLLFPVSHEPIILYPNTSNEAAPLPNGKG